MAKNISKEDVQNAIAQVKHPAIDCTLVELGIVKEVATKDNKVTIVMAFPFPFIPIGDYLVNSVKNPIENLGAEVEVKITVMDENERQRFFALEEKNWKGGI